MVEKDYSNAPGDCEQSNYLLTSIELKNRLKHIAGLCYSLCIDISNAEIEAEYLRIENTILRQRLSDAGLKVPHLKKKIKAELRRKRLSDK